ncbi:2OG-Fe(II) oxygenase [Sphingomonas crusticola]|uniref:2OG-Fe(II) oxygenase n=1 Tax=Sphingomonas crusticola TaxID=1697973 RepID=UPI000E243428|nr:2OG-Fe(II) oxygenase family protein [Sphingomonas crusticola]
MRLNPDHDLPALARAYAERGRLQVRDLMAVEDAERAYAMLAETPWSIAFNEGKTVHRLSPDQIAALSQQQTGQLMAGIAERARNQFQFLYNYDPTSVRYFAPAHPRLQLFELYEFLNSPLMLNFFRTLTGQPDILWADAQATLYRPGHFLKCHDDINHQEKRVAAYVLSLTKGWEKDWGGYLQFFDADGDVVQAIRPAFNAVSVFTVPVPHSVEMVAHYAPGLRLSLTGWLRADDPPGPIPRG